MQQYYSAAESARPARPMVMASCRGLERTLANCSTVIVPEAGHFFPLAKPEFFAETVRDFLDELQGKETVS